MARLTMRTVSRPRPAAPRELTLAEQIDRQIDHLTGLLPMAANLSRRPEQSNELLDGLTAVGKCLCRLGRG